MTVAGHACASDQQPKSSPNQKRHTSKIIIPWIEVNVPSMRLARIDSSVSREQGGTTLRDHCVKGLQYWGKVTDTVIVTTTVGQVVEVYTDLMRLKPGHMKIIGGIKTYSLPGCSPEDDRACDFSNAEEWARFAKVAEQIAEITGTKVVVLENETALHDFHTAKASIDFDRLTSSLGLLRAKGIHPWCAIPLILGNTSKMPDRRRMTTKLVKSFVDADPKAVFLPAYVGWSGWQHNSELKQRRDIMIDMVGKNRCFDRFYVQSSSRAETAKPARKRFHTPPEALEQMATLEGDIVIIYPGAINWVSVGKEFASLLAPAPTE